MKTFKNKILSVSISDDYTTITIDFKYSVNNKKFEYFKDYFKELNTRLSLVDSNFVGTFNESIHVTEMRHDMYESFDVNVLYLNSIETNGHKCILEYTYDGMITYTRADVSCFYRIEQCNTNRFESSKLDTLEAIAEREDVKFSIQHCENSIKMYEEKISLSNDIDEIGLLKERIEEQIRCIKEYREFLSKN